MKKEHRRIIVIGAVGTALNFIEQIIDARKNYRYSSVPEGILVDSYQ